MRRNTNDDNLNSYQIFFLVVVIIAALLLKAASYERERDKSPIIEATKTIQELKEK